MNWKNIIKAEWKEPNWRDDDDEGKHRYDYPFSFNLFSEANWLSQEWISNLKRLTGDYSHWTEDIVESLIDWSNEMVQEITPDLDSDTDEAFNMEDRKGFIAQNTEKLLEMLSNMMENIFSKAISSAKYNIDSAKDTTLEQIDIKWDEPISQEVANQVFDAHKGNISSAIKKVLDEHKQELEAIGMSMQTEKIINSVLTNDNMARVYSTIFIIAQIKFQNEIPKRQAGMSQHEDEGEDAHVAEFKDKDGFDSDFTDKYTSSNWWKYIRNGVW